MLRDRITYLDGTRLHHGLRAGIRRLLARQSFLNKINVYPVPDGETGGNMGFTLLAIVDQPDTAQSHAGRTAVAIDDDALGAHVAPGSLILALQPVGIA